MFTENRIGFDIADELTDADLKELGVAQLGERKRLLKAIRERGAERGEPEGERRQVTVLFADIAGYTSLSSRLDPEEIHSLLNAYFEAADGAVHDHGGTIDKHIGDAVMAIFGAPVAHTDDPLRAVLAAMEIHTRIAQLDTPLDRPLSVHIGIASGEVVASGTGSGTYQEYTVIGSSVNLASRLDGLADAGETYVNDDVYRAVADEIEGRSVGDVAVKGFDDPVSVWAIEGRRRGEVEDGTVLVGRDAECASFARAVETARTKREGRIFYLRGEPGIGKSCLAEAFRREAQSQGFASYEAMILDFGAATGRQALRSIAAGLAGPAHDDSDLAPERAAHLRALLDLPFSPKLRVLYDAMDNDTRDQGRRRALARLVGDAASRQPILIYIDNLYWADPVTLSDIAVLLDTACNHPVMFLLTSRHDGDPMGRLTGGRLTGGRLTGGRLTGGRLSGGFSGSQDWQSRCEVLDLSPLARAEGQDMAAAYGLTDPDLVARCLERAGGNPLFLEQIFHAAKVGDGEALPGSVQSVVLTRMDALEATDRGALQAASVMGQRFGLDDLRTLIDRPDYDCRALMEHGLVRPDGDQMLFSHALVADGIYGSLLAGRRSALHLKAAANFAGRNLALHAEHLDRGGAAEAVQAYIAASRAETENYRYQRALPFIERGIELAATGERAELHGEKGDLLILLGQPEDAILTFGEVAEMAQDRAGQVRAQIGIAAAARMLGKVDDGMAALDAAEAAGEDEIMDSARSQIHYFRGTFLFILGDVAAGVAEQERAIAHGEKANEPEWIARGLSGLGDAQYAEGRMPTARASFERCMEICETEGFGQIAVANRYMVLNMHRYLNDFHRALDGFPAAIETAEQVGNLRAEMLARLLYGEMLTDAGQCDGALENLERALEIIRGFGNRRMEAYILNHKARAVARNGDAPAGRQIIDQAWSLSRETDTAFIGARICGTRAFLAGSDADRAKALADGEEILAGGVLFHNVMWFLRDAIEASLQGGNWDLAADYAERLEELTAAEPIPWCDVFIERGRVLVAQGRGEDTAERRAAIDAYIRDIGFRF
ncbi:MAG: AAA family ATPase, partial [Rhodospirillaceae bacterium]|nr:AAA family ATPase [Rhodospirillaceae bacterium]